MTSDNVKWLAGQETAGGDLIPPPDPVVVRLEREVDRLKALNEDKQLHLDAYCKAADSDRAEIRRLTNEITAYNDRLNAIPTMCQPPQTVEDGLRFLAAWFDAMYPNDPDTQVQDDCRRWANEIEQLRTDNARLRGLLREAVDDIRQRAFPDRDWLKLAQRAVEAKP